CLARASSTKTDSKASAWMARVPIVLGELTAEAVTRPPTGNRALRQFDQQKAQGPVSSVLRVDRSGASRAKRVAVRCRDPPTALRRPPKAVPCLAARRDAPRARQRRTSRTLPVIAGQLLRPR